jgi:hypothetical protein
MWFLKKEKDGKRGGALIFYYLGHGASLHGYTSIILNEQWNTKESIFPIERKLRGLSTVINSVVFATLNCSR